MARTQPEELLTAQQIADRLNLDASAITRRIQNGSLAPDFVTARGIQLFKPSSIARVASTTRRTGTPLQIDGDNIVLPNGERISRKRTSGPIATDVKR